MSNLESILSSCDACVKSHRLLHDNHGLRGKISSRISTFNVHARLEQAHCRRITDV